MLMKKLKEVREDDASAKSLVFSQYTTTIEWLGTKLRKDGFQFRTLDGKMSRQARTKALLDFERDPNVTVFLISIAMGILGVLAYAELRSKLPH